VASGMVILSFAWSFYLLVGEKRRMAGQFNLYN
jgi:hypothetical protein